jgi:preprotein translocase subunit SecB
MLLSPVNLEHYNLTRLDIETIEGYQPSVAGIYPDFDHASFSAQVDISEVTGENIPNPPAYQITLNLVGEPKSEHSFPYRFNVGAVGFFSFRGPETGGARDDIVSVSGCGMLYSSLRDVLLGMTIRFPHGPILLPTVSFMDVRKNSPAAVAPGTTDSALKRPRKASTKTVK